MSIQYVQALCAHAVATLAQPADGSHPAPTLVERFHEIVVVALGALYTKAPTTGQIYDRLTLARITEGLDDGEAASLGRRTDDWMRLEGIIRQEEGKRTYYLPLSTHGVLTMPSEVGLFGEVCSKILQRYQADVPSAATRAATASFGASLLTLLAGR